jgi:hypothetical protein
LFFFIYVINIHWVPTMCHNWGSHLFCLFFFFESGFCYVAQSGTTLEITSVCHHVLFLIFFWEEIGFLDFVAGSAPLGVVLSRIAFTSPPFALMQDHFSSLIPKASPFCTAFQILKRSST